MFKYLILLFTAGFLMACEPQNPQQINYILPSELDDCKVYQIDSKTSPILYVVRCSGQASMETSASWRVQSGKTSNTYHTILIDGVEYKKVEK